MKRILLFAIVFSLVLLAALASAQTPQSFSQLFSSNAVFVGALVGITGFVKRRTPGLSGYSVWAFVMTVSVILSIVGATLGYLDVGLAGAAEFAIWNAALAVISVEAVRSAVPKGQ